MSGSVEHGTPYKNEGFCSGQNLYQRGCGEFQDRKAASEQDCADSAEKVLTTSRSFTHVQSVDWLSDGAMSLSRNWLSLSYQIFRITCLS